MQRLTINICIVLLMLAGFADCNAPSDRHPGTDRNNDSTLIRKLASLDVPLGKPKPGEWLYVRNELGQSFGRYRGMKRVQPDATHNIIFIQPIGVFTAYQDSVIKYTADYISIFFGLTTKLLPTITGEHFPEIHKRKFSDGSEQLLTTDILNYLHKEMPEDGIVMMAVTSKDLYPGKQLNFVFGQASPALRVSVSSLYRYHIGVLDSIHYNVVLERLIKTSAHEIGHMFSCLHCIHAVCIMNGSNSLEEADSRPNRLCSHCHQKLQLNIGFDVQRRIQELGSFFLKHRLMDDHQIMVNELTLIRSVK
jgi:archaemetzincin